MIFMNRPKKIPSLDRQPPLLEFNATFAGIQMNIVLTWIQIINNIRTNISREKELAGSEQRQQHLDLKEEIKPYAGYRRDFILGKHWGMHLNHICLSCLDVYIGQRQVWMCQGQRKITSKFKISFIITVVSQQSCYFRVLASLARLIYPWL